MYSTVAGCFLLSVTNQTLLYLLLPHAHTCTFTHTHAYTHTHTHTHRLEDHGQEMMELRAELQREQSVRKQVFMFGEERGFQRIGNKMLD